MVDTKKSYSFYFRRSGRCVEKLFDSADKLLEYIKKYHKTVHDIYHSETGKNYERYVVVAEDEISKRIIPYGTIYTP